MMYYIGVDLGGTNIATGIMDEEGKILAKYSTKTGGDRAPEEITASIAETVKAVISKSGAGLNEIEGIGIGVPGCFDNESGKVLFTNNMNLSGFNVVKELQKYFDKPVYMGNDANCAVLGEMIDGGAKGYNNVVMITIGTGVGGGFVSNGKMYGGVNGAAMEVGHIVIKESDGMDCNCGRKGCWESYASARALVRYTKEALAENKDTLMHKLVAENGGKVNGRTSFDAARAGDEAANKVVDKFVYYLSLGLADLINIFQPDVLLVGGGISNEGDFLLDRVRKVVASYTYGYDVVSVNTKIKKAELTNDAGIIGAGMMVNKKYR